MTAQRTDWSADQPTDWIRPGAEVVVYRDDTSEYFAVTTVRTVAAKSFTVHGRDERFSLATLETKRISSGWSTWRYRIARPDSAKHRELHAARLLRDAGNTAYDAVAAWQRHRNRKDPALLGAAIDALVAYRDMLAPEDGRS